jgi:hypothetical protein
MNNSRSISSRSSDVSQYAYNRKRDELVGKGLYGYRLEEELRKWEERQKQRPDPYLASINSARGSR